MAIKRPTREQLSDMAAGFGFHLDSRQLAEYDDALQANFDAYDAIDALPDYLPVVAYPRTPGYRPEGDENRYGAWARKSTIHGAADGKLRGRTVVVKDNICVAGVPMRNGSTTFEGYVPDVDATVVTRVLDAGGTIAGKSTCEYYCFSGGSHTSASGPVHNPRKAGHSSGGSSSGSGALVASGEVDMALMAARALLLEVADEEGRGSFARIAAAKQYAVEVANEVTDKTIRIAGGAGVTRALPLERYFRDVRAGHMQPPNGDAALEAVGQGAIETLSA